MLWNAKEAPSSDDMIGLCWQPGRYDTNCLPPQRPRPAACATARRSKASAAGRCAGFASSRESTSTPKATCQ